MAKWIEVIDDEFGKTMILFNCGLLYTKHSYWVTYNVKRKKKKLLYRKLNRKLQER